MNLGHRHLATQLGLAALFARALDQLAFAMAQLLRQAVRHNINRLIEIVPMVLRMEVRPAHGEVDLDDKSMLECALVIVPESDVGPDQIQPKMFQTFDFLRNIRMDGWRKLDIPWTDMNLHASS